MLGRPRRKKLRKRLSNNTPDAEPCVTWSLRLPKSIHAALKQLAKEQGRSATKQVEMLIRAAITTAPKPAAPDSRANVESGPPRDC
jgi:hypothetical protein